MSKARVLAIANQKGGVGKTTTAVNLGVYLAAAGARVLLIDVDPQANATSSLGFDKHAMQTSIYDTLVDSRPLREVIIPSGRMNLDLAPASVQLAGAEVELVPLMAREHRLARALDAVREQYHVVLVDCPPSLGLLTLNALAAANGVLIPLQSEYLALEGLMQLRRTIQLVVGHVNPGLAIFGIVLTMFDMRNNLSGQVQAEVRQHFPGDLLQSVIPRSVRLSEAPSHGQSILEYDPLSRGAQAYEQLAAEVLRRLQSSDAARTAPRVAAP
ncbi:MAG TPA: ParA family protein [Chloroflexia bacterium]|nr:ParA family protein [Chloroflexia bacterium]